MPCVHMAWIENICVTRKHPQNTNYSLACGWHLIPIGEFLSLEQEAGYILDEF